MKHTILIVEDDSVQRKVIAAALLEFSDKYICVLAKDGKEAIEMVKKHLPVLILTDWELPIMSGVESIREIRKIEGYKNVPILVITGRNMEKYIEEAIQAGATDYLEKPINIGLLISRVKLMLNLASLQREQDFWTGAIEYENKELTILTRVLEHSNDKLFKSEERYKALAENFPNGTIGVYNRKLEAVFLSGKEFENLPIKPEQLVGKTLTQILGDFSANSDEAVYRCQQAFEGKEQYMETELLSNIYLQRAVPLRDSNGEINQIMVVSQNVTKERKAERKLRKSKALVESINQLTPHFIYTFDLEKMKYTYFNRNPLKHLGYSDSQIKKLGDKFLSKIIPPEGLPNVLEYIETFKFKKEGEVGEYIQKLVGGDGKTRWILSHEQVFRRNENGIPVEIIGSAQDITKLKKYEQQLLQLNNSKDRVLSTVAHDLRNPILTIKGMLTVLRMSLDNTSAQDQQMIEMVESSCNKALGLISELLEISKMEEEGYKLETELIDFGRFIGNVVKPFKNRISKDSKLTLDLSEKKAFANIHKGKFSRVIENLLTNAKKFTNDGGEVKVSTEISKNNILISIADNGIGIPANLQPVIFDRFSKAGRVGLKGEKSTGLGMSIVKQIVELHQGKIWLESEEGKGSTFFIEIPREEKRKEERRKEEGGKKKDL